MGLYEFIAESNRIENINIVSDKEIETYNDLLALSDCLYISDICNFVRRVANAELRDRIGMNVEVGGKTLKGGPSVSENLFDILNQINWENTFTPWQAHIAYERLHPFMDGNGRSGRAIWAWHMISIGEDPFDKPFLQKFYYQTIRSR